MASPQVTAPPGFAVEVEGLSKRYGGRLAVDGLDLRLRPGTITGFVGPNGAGKTTTIRMLLGLIAPSAGRGTVLGEPLGRPERYLHAVGALIEGPAFTPTLSARRNLQVLARLGGIRAGRVGEVLDQVGLADRAADPVRSFSLGMRQRLGIAAALLPSPRLLVLDEPTNGLDPAGIREVRALLRRLADGGMTVLVSSHLLSEVEAIADDVVILRSGTLVWQGAVADLMSAQRHTLRLRPDRDEDLHAVAEVAVAMGLPADVLPDGEVLVTAGPEIGGRLNQETMAAGLVLRALVPEQPSLEQTFFALTDPADVPTAS